MTPVLFNVFYNELVTAKYVFFFFFFFGSEGSRFSRNAYLPFFPSSLKICGGSEASKRSWTAVKEQVRNAAVETGGSVSQAGGEDHRQTS